MLYLPTMKKVSLVGITFGNLKVQAEAPKVGKNLFWVCICSCGESTIVQGNNLKSGNTTSCGCIRAIATGNRVRSHGNRESLEYGSWTNMKQRCLNPNNTKYSYYGGRGISIAPQWIKSFAQFLHDVGRRPTNLHSLDRINVNGNYEPGNVRWATKKEQAVNRRKRLTKCPMCGSAINPERL